MYYGNPSASSESNGIKVFDIFEDFSDLTFHPELDLDPRTLSKGVACFYYGSGYYIKGNIYDAQCNNEYWYSGRAIINESSQTVHEACRTAAKTYSVSFPNGIK
jgi:hypothetical protein